MAVGASVALPTTTRKSAQVQPAVLASLILRSLRHRHRLGRPQPQALHRRAPQPWTVVQDGDGDLEVAALVAAGAVTGATVAGDTGVEKGDGEPAFGVDL